jgi:hypothetical protein
VRLAQHPNFPGISLSDCMQANFNFVPKKSQKSDKTQPRTEHCESMRPIATNYSQASTTSHDLILHFRCCVPTKPPPLSVGGYSIGTVLRTYQRHRTREPSGLALVPFRSSETTYDIIPEEYLFSGGPSSVGTISNAAKIPAMFAHMLLRAKKRPGHSRAPKPNAWFGKAGTVGENQRSG